MFTYKLYAGETEKQSEVNAPCWGGLRNIQGITKVEVVETGMHGKQSIAFNIMWLKHFFTRIGTVSFVLEQGVYSKIIVTLYKPKSTLELYPYLFLLKQAFEPLWCDTAAKLYRTLNTYGATYINLENTSHLMFTWLYLYCLACTSNSTGNAHQPFPGYSLENEPFSNRSWYVDNVLFAYRYLLGDPFEQKKYLEKIASFSTAPKHYNIITKHFWSPLAQYCEYGYEAPRWPSLTFYLQQETSLKEISRAIDYVNYGAFEGAIYIASLLNVLKKRPSTAFPEVIDNLKEHMTLIQTILHDDKSTQLISFNQ